MTHVAVLDTGACCLKSPQIVISGCASWQRSGVGYALLIDRLIGAALGACGIDRKSETEIVFCGYNHYYWALCVVMNYEWEYQA